ATKQMRANTATSARGKQVTPVSAQRLKELRVLCEHNLDPDHMKSNAVREGGRDGGGE
ncbi:hypothetical protein NQZ68_028105, partial [Dissostichus eleginoides]